MTYRNRALALGLLMVATPLVAATPQWQEQINYQGQLTDNGGNAVPDGTYNITFRLYKHAISLAPSNLVWAGETQIVNVTRGLFNAYLGQLLPLPTLSPAQLEDDLYLSVQVAGDPGEMLPRQKLLAAFFARNALSLQGHLPNNTPNNLLVLDGVGKLPTNLLTVPLLLNGAGAASAIQATNECYGCNAGIFTNVTATGGSSGAALRVSGRIAAPDIVNTFVASAGVNSQVVTCIYCKAGDEVFLMAKGNSNSNSRCWVNSVNNGSFSLGFSSGGFSSSISMAYLVVGDL